MHIFVGDGNSNERKTFDISCKSGYSKGLWGFDSIFVLDLTQKSYILSGQCEGTVVQKCSSQ